MKVECLNCGYEFEVESYDEDELGKFVICPECKSSFDIDVEEESN